MTNKEKALMLVWEHLKVAGAGMNYEEFKEMLLSKYLGEKALKHAKLTASKIAEYNPEEGKGILEELEKI